METTYIAPTESVSTGKPSHSEHISVCVCTCRRPQLLAQLIKGLLHQTTRDAFSYSIIIVDNDPSGSARETVDSFISQSEIQIKYLHEPNPGITYARNKSIENSTGDYIAFIDDDEVPEEDWLYQLYSALKTYDADAVFGSVLPVFEVEPPAWILNRRYFYWRDARHQTGSQTIPKRAVTNNALVRRDAIVRYHLRFDHHFAFTGGEDNMFFIQLAMRKRNAKYIECAEAIVHEFIPADRCKPDYIVKRNILEANVLWIPKLYPHSRLMRAVQITRRFVTSWCRVIGIVVLFPFILFFDKDRGLEYYYRSFFHFGRLLSIFKAEPYADRRSIGLH